MLAFSVHLKPHVQPYSNPPLYSLVSTVIGAPLHPRSNCCTKNCSAAKYPEDVYYMYFARLICKSISYIYRADLSSLLVHHLHFRWAHHDSRVDWRPSPVHTLPTDFMIRVQNQFSFSVLLRTGVSTPPASPFFFAVALYSSQPVI